VGSSPPSRATRHPEVSRSVLRGVRLPWRASVPCSVTPTKPAIGPRGPCPSIGGTGPVRVRRPGVDRDPRASGPAGRTPDSAVGAVGAARRPMVATQTDLRLLPVLGAHKRRVASSVRPRSAKSSGTTRGPSSGEVRRPCVQARRLDEGADDTSTRRLPRAHQRGAARSRARSITSRPGSQPAHGRFAGARASGALEPGPGLRVESDDLKRRKRVRLCDRAARRSETRGLPARSGVQARDTLRDTFRDGTRLAIGSDWKPPW